MIFLLCIATLLTTNLFATTVNTIEQLYKQVERDPSYVRARLQLAQALQKNKQHHEAFQHYKAVVTLHTTNFDAYLGMGQILTKENQLHEALHFFKAAVKTRPADKEKQKTLANALLQLGITFFNQHDGASALQTFKTILQINKQYWAVHHNIGFTLAERLGRHIEAIEHYRTALELNQNNPEVHFCYALSLLATGQFADGWHEYTERWQRPGKEPRNDITTFERQWTGEDLHNKTILLRAEQGLGDTLHFIRYAQLCKNEGAFVIAEVQKPLVKLLSLCPYIDQLIPMGQPVPPFDYQIPLLTLPKIFKTSTSTIPANIPYLYADEKLEKKWPFDMPKKSATQGNIDLRVGLCWFGDAAHGQTKFMPLKKLEPLMQLDGVEFYSLQKFTGLDQIKHLSPDVELHIFDDDFDRTHGSFMDTAALMKHLDLVITADTSVAHLAGGLGVPVWILLPFPAEWRWLMDRSDSPWYPSARLFRQKKPGDWSDVQKELLAALQEKVAIAPAKKLIEQKDRISITC